MARADQSTYIGRKSQARSSLTEFLATFVPPRGLDDDQQAARIDSIADAFARKMPVEGDFSEAVQAVFTRVSDTHDGITWPSQATFVMAMPKGSTGRPAPQSYRPDSDAGHYGGLMAQGQPVPESVLWGVLAPSLPAGALERYRSASVMQWIDAYGPDAEAKMRNRFGHAVASYFPTARVAE